MQIAKICGAGTILLSSSDEKLERAKQLGASEVINYKQTVEWGEAVLDLTEGQGVDQVIELGGAETLAQSLKAVRVGGQINLIGFLSGVSTDFNFSPLIIKNVRLQGIVVGSREMFEAMNAAFSLHQVRPVISRIFSFDRSLAAFTYLARQQHFGKVVIEI